MVSTTEILSPAGSRAMLEAAVLSGADAVYLGAKDFSARRNAENFSIDELYDAVAYCHIRGVKVYLTLNIILKDSEMQSAVNTAVSAYNAGIDGIILADLGLAAILKKELPELPLHASTQLSVHSPSALEPLKELGFSRVVVAREMSYLGLKEICIEAKRLDLEIEAFVHGALCMSVSGQCLLSAFLGSRSGNRGLCAGPCRLPFRAENGTGYDLSLKDLSLLEFTKELEEIGVTSFKIEGRMKRPEYVAAATAAFRRAIDTGEVDENLADTLNDVFSRSGFTSGYFEDKLGRDMFGIRTKDDVLSAPSAFPIIHELYRRERQNIAVSITAVFKESKPIRLVLSDGENEVEVVGDIPENAKNRATTKDDILKNLIKFGSTPYFAECVEIDIDEGLFIAASSVNALRREAAELLSQKRAQKFIRNMALPSLSIPQSAKQNNKQKVYMRVESISQIPEKLDGVDAIIVPLECENVESIKADIPLIVDIPRGILSESAILKRLTEFKNQGFYAALCGNIAAFSLAKQAGLEIIADSSMNTINSFATKTLEDLGAEEILLSNEILLDDAKRLSSNKPIGITAYGKTPLMLFRNCPIKNGKSCSECSKQSVITDRLGISFPIRCRMGFSEMLNSLPIFLADRKKEYFSLNFIVLYFTDEEPSEVSDIISAYKNGLPPKTKYTRGLFYRGSL